MLCRSCAFRCRGHQEARQVQRKQLQVHGTHKDRYGWFTDWLIHIAFLPSVLQNLSSLVHSNWSNVPFVLIPKDILSLPDHGAYRDRSRENRQGWDQDVAWWAWFIVPGVWSAPLIAVFASVTIAEAKGDGGG